MLPDFKAGSLNEIGSTTMAWVVGKLCISLEVNLESNGKSPIKVSNRYIQFKLLVPLSAV